MAIIGNNNSPVTENILLGNFICASGPFQTVTAFDVDTMYLYINGTINGGITLGIFDDNAGLPGNLLGVTSEITSFSYPAGGWISAPLGSPVSLSTGTDYWLAWISDLQRSYYYEAGSASDYIKLKAETYSAGSMPDPFPASPASIANRIYSIYGYGEASGGPEWIGFYNSKKITSHTNLRR